MHRSAEEEVFRICKARLITDALLVGSRHMLFIALNRRQADQ